jgi:hypothetical protein
VTHRFRRQGAAGLLLANCLLLQASPARAQPVDPVELMRRVQRQATAPDEQVEFSMELIADSGQTRQRTGTMYERQVAPESLDEQRLIRFHSPADFQGSGVLTIEHPDRDDDQWLYLPAYHTTRRVAPANRGDRYMGTDFLYEDITREKIEEYRYLLSREESFSGARCLVLEARPAAEKLAKETAYSKKLMWVDPARDVILRIDYYDRTGNCFKRFTAPGIEKVSNRYRWSRVRMEDLNRHHTTTVVYHNRRVGEGVPARYFTEQYLKAGQ